MMEDFVEKNGPQFLYSVAGLALDFIRDRYLYREFIDMVPESFKDLMDAITLREIPEIGG